MWSVSVHADPRWPGAIPAHWLNHDGPCCPAALQRQAEGDQVAAVAAFLAWASRYVPDAVHMNLSSPSQIKQLLFPGYCKEPVSKFKVRTWATRAQPLPARPRPSCLRHSSTLAPTFAALPCLPSRQVDNPRYAEYEAALATGGSMAAFPTRVTKHHDIELHGIWGRGQPGQLVPTKFTDKSDQCCP